PPPPHSTLFPYTTLFRSNHCDPIAAQLAQIDRQFPANRRGFAVAGLHPRQAGISIVRAIHHVGEFAGFGDGVSSAEYSGARPPLDRKSTRLNSSHLGISY